MDKVTYEQLIDFWASLGRLHFIGLTPEQLEIVEQERTKLFVLLKSKEKGLA